jgi:hypothetical protein
VGDWGRSVQKSQLNAVELCLQNNRQPASSSSRQWKAGDECMAKYWQDKQVTHMYQIFTQAIGQSDLKLFFEVAVWIHGVRDKF